MDYKKELDLLLEYMNIYIQLLCYCTKYGGLRILETSSLPTFEYFKEVYYDEAYSLSKPHYRDLKYLSDGKLVDDYCKGIGENWGEEVRYYNDWMGCKFFIEDVNGKFKKVNKEL